MLSTRFHLILMTVFSILLAVGEETNAGRITVPLPSSGNGMVVGPGLGSGSTVNSDLTGFNNDNKVEKGDSFVSMDLSFGNLARIDTVFSVNNSGGFMLPPDPREDTIRNPGGTTEYWYEVVVLNNTNMAWAGLGFELGFGTGNNFQRSTISDFLDFDTPDNDPPPNRNGQEQNQFQHQANTLVWTGRAGMQAGAFYFMFDVPDFNNRMPQQAQAQNGYQFTLRANPAAVPEPSTLALFVMGILVMMGYGWRRRRTA